ncbi:MAG: helix-turn-helix transcriptional regulator [Deltaproteobacteria bacterium]|nr:helix-turn-helix transcriptional regulator [Nannocystaceae bacterium]
MASDPAGMLATNVRMLREARGLTQVQLAKLAELPRATWANLESGASNPTLAVLLRVAAALQVSLDELVAPPRASARHYLATELPQRRRGAVGIRKLLPDPLPGLDVERIELPAGAGFSGVPHTPGTREYLTCEIGELELAVAGTKYRLAPGDVVVFRGDQNHGYRNPGRVLAVAFSAVVLAPDAPIPTSLRPGGPSK